MRTQLGSHRIGTPRRNPHRPQEALETIDARCERSINRLRKALQSLIEPSTEESKGHLGNRISAVCACIVSVMNEAHPTFVGFDAFEKWLAMELALLREILQMKISFI